MFSIPATPDLSEMKLSFRDKLKNSVRRVRCSFSLGATQSQSGAGILDYSTAPMYTLGSTVINGLLIPEKYVGQFLEPVGSTANFRIGDASIKLVASVNTT